MSKGFLPKKNYSSSPTAGRLREVRLHYGNRKFTALDPLTKKEFEVIEITHIDDSVSYLVPMWVKSRPTTWQLPIKTP